MRVVIISGVLFIDKSEGITSTQVDRICKRYLHTKKIGHIGTLDPFASGLLPIAINGATKLIQYFKWTNIKTYVFEIQFGIQTNTGDSTGIVINTSSIIPTLDEVKQILCNFIGNIQQIPHIFSAIKINGKKSYELARCGIVPNIKPKTITIYDLKVLSQYNESLYKFEATVSSGTYIRSLTEDIAKTLGTIGYTKSLRRTRMGAFSNGLSLDAVFKNLDNISEAIVSVEDLLDDIPVVHISDSVVCDLKLGRKVKVELEFVNASICLVKSDNGFMALGERFGSYLQPRKLVQDFGG